MKAILFSSDFVYDNQDNLRLLEINTDTQIPTNNLNLIDFAPLVSLLNEKNITKVSVVYKPNLHKPFIEHFSSSLNNLAPFINTFTRYKELPDSIYPTNVNDASDTLVLRMSYDEAAIFDSEYAKGKLNLLNLFADKGEQNLVTEYFYSSSFDYRNSITDTINPSNIPDFVVKSTIEKSTYASFFKVGKETENETESQSIQKFITSSLDENSMIQKYHIGNSSIVDNKIHSVRSFSLLFGDTLELLNILQYKVPALFSLPENFLYDNTKTSNKIDNKHYHEYSTNMIKHANRFDGLLGTHYIVKSDETEISLNDIQIGDTIKSYYLLGSLFDENLDNYYDWQYEGNQFPTGSYLTSSMVVIKNTSELTGKTLSHIIINNNESSSLFVSTEKAFLVYNNINNNIVWKNASTIIPNQEYFLGINGELKMVTLNELYVTEDDNLQLVGIDVEDTDTFIIGGGDQINSINTFGILAHNCFVGETKVLIEDLSEKRIDELRVGDRVVSFNEKTKIKEIKEVLGIRTFKKSNLVKYILEDSTEIICTEDHPLYTKNYKLASNNPDLTNKLIKDGIYNLNSFVEKLVIGDILINNSDQEIKINNIIPIKEETQIFTLSIDTNHNFYANKILVHNK